MLTILSVVFPSGMPSHNLDLETKYTIRIPRKTWRHPNSIAWQFPSTLPFYSLLQPGYDLDVLCYPSGPWLCPQASVSFVDWKSSLLKRYGMCKRCIFVYLYSERIQIGWEYILCSLPTFRVQRQQTICDNDSSRPHKVRILRKHQSIVNLRWRATTDPPAKERCPKPIL